MAAKAAAASNRDAAEAAGDETDTPKPSGNAKGKAGPKAKAQPKGKAKGKAGPKAKAQPNGKPPGNVKNVVGNAPPCKKPCIGVEWTRNQVLARTGHSGPGQNKGFAFSGTDPSTAKKRAEAWLRKACQQQGIEYKS